MKLLFTIFLFITSTSFTQEIDTSQIILPEVEPPAVIIIIEDTGESEEMDENGVYDFPDVEANFHSGPKGLQRYMSKNVQYPVKAIENNEQGTVYIAFVVEPDGSISNIKIERGVSRALDREAKRLIKEMPKWKPGEVSDKKVRTRCRLPIIFQLTDGNEKSKKKKTK